MPTKHGSKWYNNGKISIQVKPGEEVPEGFKPGMVKTKSRYYNNGKVNKLIKEGDPVPEGFVLGMVPLSKEKISEVVEKRRKTCMEKYGVDNPAKKSEFIEKMKETNISRYGTDLPSQNDSIKKKISNSVISTNQSRYGTNSPMQSDGYKESILEKMKGTNKSRYGTDWYMQSDEGKSRFIDTCLDKYGVSNPSNLEWVKDKKSKTSIEHYGVDHPLKSPIVRKKIEQTNLSKYGEKNTFQVDIFKEKGKHTLIEKYGVDNISKSEYAKIKKIQTSLKHFGVEYPMKSREVRDKVEQTNLERYGVKNVTENEDIKQRIKDTCLERYGISWPCMLNPCVSKNESSKSTPNRKFATILFGYEMYYEREYPLGDFLYDFKVGDYLVEINPTHTHNTERCPFSRDPVTSMYHYNKSKTAKENGFFCIHVFDWDDSFQVVRFLSMVRPHYSKKECSVKEFSHDGILDIQLVHKSKVLESISLKSEDNTTFYLVEHSRVKKVIWGFKYLFDYFISEYRPDRVLVEVDNAKVDGKYLLDNGFKVVSESGPVCHWYNTSSGVHYNCHTDDVPYDYDTMISNGFLPVYDCGYTVHEWTKPELSKSKMELKLISKI